MSIARVRYVDDVLHCSQYVRSVECRVSELHLVGDVALRTSLLFAVPGPITLRLAIVCVDFSLPKLEVFIAIAQSWYVAMGRA